MVVRDTSIATYKDIIESGVLGDRQAQVYRTITDARQNMTDKELSVRSGIPINVVTPRRGELVKMGLLEESRKRKCSITQRTAYEWRLAPNPDLKRAKEIKERKAPKAKPKSVQRILKW